MYKKISIVMLILLLLFVLIFLLINKDNVNTTIDNLDTQSRIIEKQTISKGVNVFPISATVLGRYENKIYLNTPILSELDTESGQMEFFPEAKNIQLISANEEYLVGVNQNTIQGYDRKSKELLWKHTYPDVMLNVALSPIEDEVLYFVNNETIRKIHVGTGKGRGGSWIYNGFDYNPKIHLYDDFVVYFGNDATYIFNNENNMDLLKKMEFMENPLVDGDNIYYIQRISNENDGKLKTLIKKYSLSNDKVEIISEIPMYEVHGFIGMGDNQELYINLNLGSDAGIAIIEDGETTIRPPSRYGSAIEALPSKLVSLTGYYNGYIFSIDDYHQSVMYHSLEDKVYNWKEIDLTNNEGIKKYGELYNAKLIDKYLYIQGEDRLIEINLEEALE